MSLKIEKKNEGTKDTVFLTGRLDTATAPELDTFAEKELINTQELVLDFAGLEYISYWKQMDVLQKYRWR